MRTARNYGKRLAALERSPHFQPPPPSEAEARAGVERFKSALIARGMTKEPHESWAEATARFFGITTRELRREFEMRAQGAK